MIEEAQNLTEAIRGRTLKSARDFYGDSLGSLKGQLEHDRSQLQEFLEQLPAPQQAARSRLEEMIESYEAVGKSLDEVAQQQGVQDAADPAAQQAQEAAEQAQGTKVPAAQSSRRDKVQGAATGAAGKALELAGSLTGDRRTRIKGFLARRKGPSTRRRPRRRNWSTSRTLSAREVQAEHVGSCRSGKAVRLPPNRAALDVLPLSKTRGAYLRPQGFL